jgi:hypothetical protein
MDPTNASVLLALLFSLLHPSSKGHGCVAATSSCLQTCDLLPSPDISLSRISGDDDFGQIRVSRGQTRTFLFPMKVAA